MSKYKVGDEVILHNLPVSTQTRFEFGNKIGKLIVHSSGSLEEFGYYKVSIENVNFVIHDSEFIPATETNKILFCK